MYKEIWYIDWLLIPRKDRWQQGQFTKLLNKCEGHHHRSILHQNCIHPWVPKHLKIKFTFTERKKKELAHPCRQYSIRNVRHYRYQSNPCVISSSMQLKVTAERWMFSRSVWVEGNLVRIWEGCTVMVTTGQTIMYCIIHMQSSESSLTLKPIRFNFQARSRPISRWRLGVAVALSSWFRTILPTQTLTPAVTREKKWSFGTRAREVVTPRMRRFLSDAWQMGLSVAFSWRDGGR